MKNNSLLFAAFLAAYSANAFSAEVPAQSSVKPVLVNATSVTDSTYLNFQDGVLTASADATDWQIAVKRTQFQTNSGTSGKGAVGIYDTEVSDFDAVTSCVAPSLTSDELLPASGAPGSLPYSGNAVLNAWYDYDMSTHIVTSKKHVYLVVEGDSCFKFQILDYISGTFSVQAAALEIPAKEESEVFEQTINASSATETVYLTLEGGQLVPATQDADWFVAVKRTQFQTNSGTSGQGNVGVFNTESQDFAALTSCEGLTFTYDSLLPASGAPGSLPYSGSSILNDWYNYDMSTHIVTSKQDVYALSNGTQCFKFQILGYEAGRFQVQVSEIK